MYLRREVVWAGFGFSVLFVAGVAAWEIRADSAASAPPTGISVVLESSEGNPQGTPSSAKTQVPLESSSPTLSNAKTPEATLVQDDSPISTGITTPANMNQATATTVAKQAPTSQAKQIPTTVATQTPTQVPTTTWPISPPPCALIPESERYYLGPPFVFASATLARTTAAETRGVVLYPYYYYASTSGIGYTWSGSLSLDQKIQYVRDGLLSAGVTGIAVPSSNVVNGMLGHIKVTANVYEMTLNATVYEVLEVTFLTPECSINS